MTLKIESGDPLPVQPPDWAMFNKTMLSDPTYQQITQQTPNKLLASRAELFAQQAVEVSLLKYQWDSLIKSVSVDLITGVAVARWNSYAENTHMPFSFDASGNLLIESI
ncbi:MAG: hypothetical protein AAF827_03895 [Cyanobacteria bacterium P01_D01_bin.6]